MGKMLRALGTILLLMLATCTESAALRYRITVEVDTPQGLRTGSSVWNVASRSGPGIPGPEAAQVNSDVRGEAVAVDLPGGTLFALMRGGEIGVDYPARVVQRHLANYPNPRIEQTPRDWAENLEGIQRSGVRFDLREHEYPVFVNFRDPSDPVTVEQVRPDELFETFGPGVRLRRITIEMTNDPISMGIERRIPWIKSMTSNIDGTNFTSSASLSNILNSNDFQRR